MNLAQCLLGQKYSTMAKSRRLFYTMGQVCEMFDLPASTIRFWEKRFNVLTPRKNAKGNRLFSPADVENLKLIYHLTKEKKMTLSGAETFIMQRRVAVKGEMNMVEILQKIRSTLVEIRQEVETAERNSAQDIVIRCQQVVPFMGAEVDFESNIEYGELASFEPDTQREHRIEDSIDESDRKPTEVNEQLSLFNF